MLPSTFLVVVLCLSQVDGSFNASFTQGLISALIAHFWADCAIFPVLSYQRGLAEEWKIVKTERVYQGRVTLVNAPNVSSISQSSSRGLFVLLWEQHTAQLLQQIFSKLEPEDAVWLLVMGDTRISIGQLLGDVTIPFDCEFLVAEGSYWSVELREVYHIHSSRPMVTAHWGRWIPGTGLVAPSSGVTSRRRDLQGINFIAAGLHIPPAQYLQKDQAGNIQAISFTSALCYELSRQMNFSLTIVEAQDNAFGIQTKEGSWTGAIGMLLDGKINITLNPFTITAHRSKFLDYTTPFYKTSFVIYIRSTVEARSMWQVYSSPFTARLWICLCGSFLCIACILVLMYRQLPVAPMFSPKEVVVWLWGSLCAQGAPSTPPNSSIRLAMWATFVTCVVVSAAYHAKFTAFLAVRKVHIPFRDLQGLLDDNSYGLRVERGSSSHQGFINGKGVFHNLYQKKIEPYTDLQPKDIKEGFVQICKEKLAFHSIKLESRARVDALPCDVSFLPGYEEVDVEAYIVPKRSPYRRMMNIVIQKMIQTGICRKLYLQYTQPPVPKEISPPRNTQVADILCPLLMFVGGVMLSVLALLLERGLFAKNRVQQGN